MTHPPVPDTAVTDPASSDPRLAPTPQPAVVALGEPMVEFNQTGEADARLYLQGFGGDTSNFVIAAARQGARVGYITALGDDPYGAMLRNLWNEEGVDTRDVMSNPETFTAIYFVTHSERGHQFDFFRKGSAGGREGGARGELRSGRHASRDRLR